MIVEGTEIVIPGSPPFPSYFVASETSFTGFIVSIQKISSDHRSYSGSIPGATYHGWFGVAHKEGF